ncbi:hypothetical protein EJP617_31720 [Erwinia sp. Ejp617]|nr:hypothetical protein EJP617_31720 [Erwinia sp. Ejp617]
MCLSNAFHHACASPGRFCTAAKHIMRNASNRAFFTRFLSKKNRYF